MDDLNPPRGALALSHDLSSPPSPNPAVAAGGRGTTTPSANTDMHAHIIASVSSSQAAAAAPGVVTIDVVGSFSPPPPLWPKLMLDSGASVHMVSDPRLLSDLRDAPAGRGVRAADGNLMPITKIGNIHIQGGSTIPDVHLVPGLRVGGAGAGLISVRQLARQSRICTWFVGNRAMLYAGPKLVGVAVDPEGSFSGICYVLQYLRMPKTAAAAGNNNGFDSGQTRLLPVWCGSSAARAPGTEPKKRFTWSQFSPLHVHTRKQLRLRFHIQEQLRLRAWLSTSAP